VGLDVRGELVDRAHHHSCPPETADAERRSTLQICAHQSGSLIKTESSHRWPARLWLRKLERRVGIEPTTHWLGVA
jgi:hypothetical protein